MQERVVTTKTPSTVMIVEDEAIIAEDIKLQLNRLGFVAIANISTALEAFQAIEQHRPEIVLMDIRLKGEMDGVKAAEIIRNKYALPVIYLTAHTDDETLQRAQITEPFGYLVKPLVGANIKAVLTMALYKHQMERELENNRRLLATILQALPDAVVVTDPSGDVLFINRAAEQLTGWNNRDSVGRAFLQVVPIHNGDGRDISEELLHRAIAKGTLVRIPRESNIVRASGISIEISGHLVATLVGNRAAGVFVTLQDSTVQRREDDQLRQEQQMFVAGELAHGIGLEVGALFDLISNTADTLGESRPETDAKQELGLIRKASQIGNTMSAQLLELREGHGAAHVVNVEELMLKSRLMLERLCGDGIRPEVSSGPDLGYILSTGSHIDQMLMHLVLEGKQRLFGHGTLSIRADVDTLPMSARSPLSYLRLTVRADASTSPRPEAAPFPFGIESPELGLAIVRAMAIASGGFTRLTEPNDSLSVIEVFLPRHAERGDAAAATNEYPTAVFLIGFQLRFIQSVQNTAGDVVVLEAESLVEASLVSEMYSGDIDLIVINESRFSPRAKNRMRDRIRVGRPRVAFLEVDSPIETSEIDSSNSSELERRVKDFFQTRNSVQALGAVH